MTHRTQLSQADEALRQADANPDSLRTFVERIAGALTREQPTAVVTAYDLDYLANGTAWAHLKRTCRFGRVDCARREALGAALLAVMPEPRAGETRGEYAIRLRAAARA